MNMGWLQRTHRQAAQDVVTGAPMVTADAPTRHLVLRVVDGAARAMGRRPSTTAAWSRDIAMALAGLSVVVVIALWVKGQGPGELGSVTGVLHSFGRLTALLASNLLLIQVILIARVPFLE